MHTDEESSNEAPPLRIAVVGAGLIGRRHVELIVAHPRCDLAAVVDPSPAAAELAAGLGVPHHAALADLLAVESREGLGIVVATPNALHVADALRCVEAGVPVLVEKPVSDSLGEAGRLARAVEETGARVLVGHHRRHSPILVEAARVVRDGTLGSIVAVQGSAVFYKPDDYFEVAPWRREEGGGPILINMIHEVDDLRTLCGDVDEVTAVASRRTRGFPVEDTVAMTLRFRSGALGTFLLSDAAASARSWELTSGENRAYPSHPDENCYEIAGTRGSLAVPTLTLRRYPGTPSWWEPLEVETVPVSREDPLARQLDHFLRVVAGIEEPLVTAGDATLTLATTLAIAESARSGRSVRPETLLEAVVEDRAR